jgi:hypothetical protein
VAPIDWATCPHTIRHIDDTCRLFIRQLSTIQRMPRHLLCQPGPRRMLTSACATCHPSNGDTCHFQIGQTVLRKCQKCMTRVTPRSCHVSCTDRPRMLYGLPRVLYGLYGQVQSASFFLPVWLGEQTSITSPYGLRLRK